MLEPVEWNVVVLGRWNQSILTPEWIGKNLFNIASGDQLNVELAIDVMLPARVIHDNLRVAAGSQNLVIDSLGAKFSELDKARELARNSMGNLSATPISAVGVNVRYDYKVADSNYTRILELMHTELDDQLATIADDVNKQSLTRSIPIDGARLNFSIFENEDNCIRIQFNYEYVSNEISKLDNWLKWPIDECKNYTQKMLVDALGFSEGMIPNE